MHAQDTARLSSRFQISIPKTVGAAHRWQAAQEIAFVPRGTGVPTADALAGMAHEFPERGPRLVPTIVQLEPARWMWRELGEDAADPVIAFTATCVVAERDTPIALLAEELGLAHKLATADAAVYATALAHGADLPTCDRHFEGLRGGHLVPKGRA